MDVDIIYTLNPNETIIHPNSAKGASWISAYLTTNVTDLHYTDVDRAKEILRMMREDGLEISE